MNTSLSIIILNWNRLNETLACVEVLAEHRRPGTEILIIDNASDQDPTSAIHSICPEATVLRQPSNRGFAGGSNAGIRYALEHTNPDFVFLLNNDARCKAETLDTLLRAAESHPRAGLLSPVIEERDERGRTIRIRGYRMRRPFWVPGPCTEGKADYLCGAGLLIRRACLEELGLLDEGFFFFFEDADYAFRAKQAGWNLYTVGDAVLTHDHGGTIGSMDYQRSLYYRAGHVRFLRKHARHAFFASGVAFLYSLIKAVCRGRWAAFSGSLEGWKQGWQTVV